MSLNSRTITTNEHYSLIDGLIVGSNYSITVIPIAIFILDTNQAVTIEGTKSAPVYVSINTTAPDVTPACGYH